MSSKPEITQVDYFDEHFYKIEHPGESVNYYPSVTTKLGIINKPFLMKWRGDIGNREADVRLFEAQERGSRIHHAWYTLTTGGAVLYNNWRKPVYTAKEIEDIDLQYGGNSIVIRYQDEMVDLVKLSRFLDAVNPTIVGSEQIVWSDIHREAGTVDNLFRIEEGEYLVSGKTPLFLKGGLYIADLKTGNSFDESAYLQMAAYAKMWMEQNDEEIVGTLGLHTSAQTRSGIEGFTVKLRTREEVENDYKVFRHAASLWEWKNKTAKPRLFSFPSLLTRRKQ